MDVEDVPTHPKENVVAQLLTDEEIIESVIGINKDDIDEEDDESSTMEPHSRNFDTLEVMRANISGDLYLICYDTLETCLVSSLKNEEAWLWHTRFCHLNFDTLDKLKDYLCSACEMGRLIRSSYKTKSDPSYDKPLKCYMWTSMDPSMCKVLQDRSTFLYSLMISHVLLGRVCYKEISSSYDTDQSLEEVIRVPRSDNGTKFKNSLASIGITHNFLAPRTPQQNGVVKRKKRRIDEATRTMLNAIGLLLTFRAEAVSVACYTQNRSLLVRTLEKTPYQILHNKGPNIKFFHVIQDKFTKELKTQAEKLPNATITQDLEKLFNEWDKDEDDPDRTSADAPRTSAEQQPVAEASSLSTPISGTSNGTSHLSSTQGPIIAKSISLPTEDVHSEPIPRQASDPTPQSHNLQEISSTINLPHAIKWTKDHP
ncbi:hypothetical protein OSB04_024735 [Centaurea solstitialis]|uniref:Integrase catalytic domain-containing protein n=1 Tax=Centaurea solstitialis TaxID=347529 RepID=A0AA38SU75_9ASTR|nr:hypothetical protein OSB04_024735 [Centaurea solstitialis]